MSRCRNCGVEMGPEETCVFAMFKTTVGGREIMVCCPSCASDIEAAAPRPVEPAPAAKKSVKKAPRKAKKPAKKAPRKAKKPAKKAIRKAPRKVKRGAKPKKPARRPARRKRR